MWHIDIEEEYFEKNERRANNVTCKLMYMFLVIAPILKIFSYLEVLHVSDTALLVTFGLTAIVDGILFLLNKFKAPSYFIKYYCLVSIEIVIGIMSIYPRMGIYMAYVIGPVVSCAYFDKNLTRRISFFGYVMMIIGLVFRANNMVSEGLTTDTALNWFISYGIGYTIEYLVLTPIFLTLTRRARTIIDDVLRRQHKMQIMQEQIIYSFANLIESKDHVTGQHVKRTSAYVRLIAEGLKYRGFYLDELEGSALDYICMAAPIHDIGKINIPESILCKPSGLTDEEFAMMKSHTVRGESIIHKTMSNLEDEEFLRYAKMMALYHHERWDGSGYPEGLKGRQIPLCARIMAVADVFDALVSKRSYKESMALEEAFQRLEDASGTHFEPIIVDAFLEQKEEVKKIYLEDC